MKHPERGKLIPVSGNKDKPDLDNAIEVQFNPTSLRVGLSNSLNTGEQQNSHKAAQYASSSSSSLSIELIFDTSLPDEYVEQQDSQDVRLLTRKIAERFMKPGELVEEDSENRQTPSRCLFQWGAFEFVGILEKFDETLDFFSPEGIPLRATVALTLKESDYQFRNRKADRADQAMPTISKTGNSDQPGGAENTRPVKGGSGKDKGNWRDTALYNGVENPRLPSGSEVATPPKPPGDLPGIGNTAPRSAVASAMQSAAPAFRYGNASSVGSTIEGAFGHRLDKGAVDGFSAEGLKAAREQASKPVRSRDHDSLLRDAHRVVRDSGVGFD
jgi:hypothetical protein